MHSDLLLVLVVGTALAFDFTNGFHDTANVVATSISTRALPPRIAIGMASLLNFAGAFISIAVAVLPGGGGTAQLVLGALSLAFLAAIGFLGYRLYMENRYTLWSMTTRHRAMLYGGVATAGATLIATSRLWETGFGTILWFILLGGSGLAVYQAWIESRRYSV